VNVHTTFLDRAAHRVHAQFLTILVGAYVVAALVPGPGLWLRGVDFGAGVTLPGVLLAMLLLNAGLGVSPRRLGELARRPGALAAGLLANFAVPLAYVAGLGLVLRAWHNPAEAGQVLIGLGLVAAMPVAASSAAWSQGADGDLALSLGLVVGSTLLSPVTTPAALEAAGRLAGAERLHEIAAAGTGDFLAMFVLLPSAVGLAGRMMIGDGPVAAARPALKLTNAAALVVLCYANACAALPDAVFDPDWDYLVLTLAAVAGQCAAGFGAGWLLARVLRVDAARRAALVFGLGMSNNGTGLVLASTALASTPAVLVPVLCYNLAQHLAAGVAGRWAGRTAPD
jgi:BASS family bile acid:Na+ symporter